MRLLFAGYINIVMDKTIASAGGVGAPCGKSTLTPSIDLTILFLEGSNLYSLCEGFHRMELKSFLLKTSGRSCKGFSPVMESTSLYGGPG